MTYVVNTVFINDSAGLETLLNALAGDGKTIDFVFATVSEIVVISH